jgi:hypothetical protein
MIITNFVMPMRLTLKNGASTSCQIIFPSLRVNWLRQHKSFKDQKMVIFNFFLLLASYNNVCYKYESLFINFIINWSYETLP